MKNKLFYKIFLNYVLFIFLFFILFVFISINFFKKSYINNLEEILKDTIILINENTKSDIKDKKHTKLDKFVKQIAKELNIRITIIEGNGTVIADSDRNPVEMGNHIERPEIQQALKNQTGKSIRYSSTVGEEMFYFARQFFNENYNIQYFIRTSFYLKKINSDFSDIKNKIFLISFLLFVFAIIFVYFYSKNLYKPVELLKNATTKIAKGDFEHKVIFYEDNEFKDLAENFNIMIDEVKGLFSKLKEKQDQLKIIISSIDEGILVIDYSGKIVFYNDKFNKFIGAQCQELKFYWEFLFPPELIKIIEKSKKNKTDIFENIDIKGKNYLCHTTFLKEYNEIIAILYDISKVRELEKFKKDLVANVSHELKTPLTAIKGFVETAMEETKDKKVLHYLEIVKGNTERLINIIKDLLVLSSLEHEKRKIELEDIDLKDMIKNIEKIFDDRIKEKKLKFKMEIDNRINIIRSDYSILEQLFINLIDNAIKYTDSGEIIINIYRKDEKNIVIEISDTGIGIPEEHISHIFDRFYVVDKSRSRATGGTGLGLSIVKHSVSLLGGTVAVQSKVNEGTKFIIIIPDNL